MATVYKTTFKLRRGTMAEWDAKNPILSDGEPGFAIDKNILNSLIDTQIIILKYPPFETVLHKGSDT